MLQPDNAKKWHIDGGYLPVIKSIVSDPDIIKFQETQLDGKLLKPAVDQLAAADPDRSGPLIGPYPAFQKILQGALESVLFKGSDPAKALSKAETDATALLEDYNG